MAKFKTIGILGGMGPASSWYFEKLLLDLNRTAKTDQDHPRVIHFSNSQVPSRIQALAGKGEDPLPEMIESFEKMREMGADFGVMICNTAHIYWEKISKGTSLPLLHLPQTMAEAFPKLHQGIERVILLSTTQTIEHKLYHKPFSEKGIGIVVPEIEDQELVMESIFNPEFGVKATESEVSEKAKDVLTGVIKRVSDKTGIMHALAGCTEISMVFGDSSVGGVRVVDPLIILAKKCLEMAGIEVI